MADRNEERTEEIARIRGVVARNLEKALEARGMSRTEVVARAGVSRSMLYDVLGAKSAATIDFLTKLTAVLDIDVRDFFDED